MQHFRSKNSFVHFHHGFWRLKKRIVGSIFSIGMSPFAMNVTACVIVIIINNGLQKYGGDMAIGAYGIMNRLLMLYVMIVMGLTMGMQPIIGYNYGANKPERIHKTIKLSMLYATLLMGIGFAVFQLLPEQLLLLFDASEDMLNIGGPALRIISFSFLLAGLNIIASSSCQAFGYGMYSLYISAARQLVILVPAAYLLSLTGTLSNVWLSFPVAEVVSDLVCQNLIRPDHTKTGNEPP